MDIETQDSKLAVMSETLPCLTDAQLEELLTIEGTRYYWVACPKCGWQGSSRNAAGGEPFADTGDYSEVICPKCLTVVTLDEHDPWPAVVAELLALRIRNAELEFENASGCEARAADVAKLATCLRGHWTRLMGLTADDTDCGPATDLATEAVQLCAMLDVQVLNALDED